MYHIYVIFNKEHKKTYTGQTENLKNRINLHNGDKFRNSYTSRFDGRWTLIYSEEALTQKEALVREKQLKSFRGREFIKKYIPL